MFKDLSQREKIVFWSCIAVFAALYSSISLVNHYNFRTFAWDLGIFNNAIYDYSKFQLNDNPLLSPRFSNILADHFTVLHIFMAPFRYIFGTYTLLIFQIASVLFGSVGVYKFFKDQGRTFELSLLRLLFFLSFWGVYSALAFDYHDNVLSTAFIPWLFVAAQKRNWRSYGLWAFLIIISKENMILWLLFIALGLAIIYPKDKKKHLLLALVSLVSFVLIVKVLMPAMANEGREYLHFKYPALGGTMGDAIKTIISSPKLVFSLLFENHLHTPEAAFIKGELYFMLILSGLLLLIRKPAFLLMLLPIIGQKVFSNDIGKWGINYHYSVEFAPILALGAFWVLYECHGFWSFNTKWSARVLLGISFLAGIITLDASVRTSKWYNLENQKFTDSRHYKRSFDVAEAYRILDLIPKTAAVSSHSIFASHLAFREDIYQFPVVNNADYIILRNGDQTYPQSQDQFQQSLSELRASPEWILEEETADGMLLFKRR